MPHRAWLMVLLLALLLSACGGGEPRGAAAASTAGARPKALAVASAASAPERDEDTIFVWAESRFPELFPPGAATQVVDIGTQRFVFRGYPGAGNYLALVSGGIVYGLGASTGGQLQALGSFEDYLCQASPAECGPPPARLLRVRINAGSLQCEPGSGSSRLTTRRRLTAAGITVASSDCGFGNFGVAAVCGGADTRYWMFDIDATQASAAAALGFLPTDAEVYPGKPDPLACER